MTEATLEDGLAVLDRRSRTVRLIAHSYIAVTLVYCGVLAGDLAGALDLDSQEPGPLELFGALVALIYFAIFIASVIIIARWIHRAHANIVNTGQRLETTPGWAVGWFFVPLANLFKPFQAMRELWNASHLAGDYFNQESDPLLRYWWGFWIVGNIVANIGFRFAFSDEAKAQSVGTLLDLGSSLLLIPAAWFLLKIVDAINAAQRTTLSAATTFG
jgi:hypothetical protein